MQTFPIHLQSEVCQVEAVPEAVVRDRSHNTGQDGVAEQTLCRLLICLPLSLVSPVIPVRVCLAWGCRKIVVAV